MHHFVHAVVGSVALVAGIYLLTQPVGAAENPDNYRAAQLIVKKSMMQPYVATPADIAHAHELTQQFHAQKVPPVAMRSIPNSPRFVHPAGRWSSTTIRSRWVVVT
jgi:hypothetical protein